MVAIGGLVFAGWLASWVLAKAASQPPSEDSPHVTLALRPRYSRFHNLA